MATSEKGHKNIQSVQRAIDIMNCIGDSQNGLSLKEISNILELNINTARGLVQTLLDNGFLNKNANANSYSLGYEFITKSKLVYETQINYIQEIATPFMKGITEKFNISCWLQVSFYHNIYTVKVIESPGSHYSYAPKSGANLPLHASASGKLYVAHLPDENKEKLLASMSMEKLTNHSIVSKDNYRKELDKALLEGYASELEECDVGISSIGAPFFDRKGELAGTISVAAPAVIVEHNKKSIIKELKSVTSKITNSLNIKKRALA